LNKTDLQTVIASRLEDLADQVYQLHTSGMLEEAELLQQEGLHLAEAFDSEQTFLYLSDFSTHE
jgi:hypothetical protein